MAKKTETPTNIDTTEEDNAKKKERLQKKKDFKAEYDRRVGNIDEKIAYAQNLFKLINNITQAASHGEVYIMSDEEKKKYGDKGPDKLFRDYQNLMENIAEQEEKVEKWLQKRLDSLTTAEKDSPFGKALEIAQKAQQEYLVDFVENKAEEKVKAMM